MNLPKKTSEFYTKNVPVPSYCYIECHTVHTARRGGAMFSRGRRRGWLRALVTVRTWRGYALGTTIFGTQCIKILIEAYLSVKCIHITFRCHLQFTGFSGLNDQITAYPVRDKYRVFVLINSNLFIAGRYQGVQ